MTTATRARQITGAGILVLLCLALGPPPTQVAAHQGDAVRPELLEIFGEVRRIRDAPVVDGLPDYSAAAVEKQKDALRALRGRFEALEPASWPPRDQIDYLLVRSELDMLDYGLHVYRPTSRSPNFYISSISSFGLSSGATLSRLGRLVTEPPPFDRDRARRVLDHMAAIPRILEQAKRNLTEPTQEMSRWALPALENSLESSRRFAEGLAPHFPPAEAKELVPAAERMGRALEDYRRWIEERLAAMPRAQPVGRALYEWLVRRVWLLPYDADDLLRIGEREYARYLTFTELEARRNARLPPAEAAGSTLEYARRTEADDRRIRSFLTASDVLTIPAHVGPYRRTTMPPYLMAFSLWAGLSSYRTPDGGEVKYSVPEHHPYARTYWEAGMRLDPSTNIFHDGVPGHFFQGAISSRHPSTIRRQHIERVKSEGWSTYWEEAALHLGYYDDRPRSREIVYSFLRLRALRVIIDVQMALGRMTAAQGTEALMTIPMDRRIASEEADDFFAAPTGGLVYLIGKVQIEELLGERRQQLGTRFKLREFHDDLVERAWVPIELTRWEMTGRGDRVHRLLADRTPMPRPNDVSPSRSGRVPGLGAGR